MSDFLTCLCYVMMMVEQPFLFSTLTFVVAALGALGRFREVVADAVMLYLFTKDIVFRENQHDGMSGV